MVEKKLHRVFLAVDFPDDVVKEVGRIQEVLGNWNFTGKMTELENVHLTLKFLGEIDGSKLKDVRERLKKIVFGEMELRVGEIGTFGKGGNPRIVWIKIDGKGIFELQKKVDDALEGLFEKEKRFMSHMTIARVKYVKDKKGFIRHVRGIGVRDLKFKVGAFSLKESELGNLGPTYTDLEVYGIE